MKAKNKQEFPRKKLSMYIKMASSLSLVVGAMGGFSVAYAQDATDDVEEVMVTGQRASILSAQDVKRNSNVIVDSIVADDIGKLPDRSVTEALQRVPGVSVGRYTNNDAEHPAAEGSGVAIRGLTQVRGELNGRDVFSASSGRGLSFEDVPAELMYAVDTYKSPSADMIEGGLGGTVNLRTRMPFDSEGELTSFGVKVNYGDQLKEANGEYSGLYSNRWETDAGEFGFLVNVSTSDLASRSDQIYSRPFLPRTDVADDLAWVSKGVDWRRNDFHGSRDGKYLALQWAPNDDTEVYFTAFQSSHDSVYDENAFFIGNGNGDQALMPTDDNDWVYNENGAMVSGTATIRTPNTLGIDFGTSTRWAKNTSTTTDYSAGVKWSPDDSWKFAVDLQYVKAEANVDDYTLGLMVFPAEATLSGIGTETPSILVDPDFMANYENYSLGQEMTHFERNNADAKTARFDAEYDFDGAIIKSVKAGIRYSEKSSDNINTPYDWNTRYATWFGFDKNSIPKVSWFEAKRYLTLYSFDNFQRGDVAVPAAGYLYSSAAVKDFRATTDAVNRSCATSSISWACDGFVYPDWQGLAAAENRNIQDESTAAIYVMTNFGFDDLAMPIDGNVGVRIIQTDNTSHGFLTIPVAYSGEDGSIVFPGYAEPLDYKNSYTHVLPSLNIRLQAMDDLYFRFAASKAIWAPDFSQLKARIRLNPSTSSEGVTTWSLDQDSNPFLEPMTSNQFDLSAEWYFDSHGGMAYAAVFNKQLEGYFRKAEEVTSFDLGGGVSVPAKATWLGNLGSGDVTGIELGVNKFFDSLPAPFDGLGMQVNYTHINSEINAPSVASPIDTDRSEYIGALPMEQLSKNAFNLVGMFEKDGISARLAYSWRSKYLVSVGSNGFNPDFPDGAGGSARIPVYNDDYGQLDASISYTFMDNYTIALDATNLLKTKTVGIMEQGYSGSNVAYTYAQDARYSLGLRAKF